MNYQDICQAKQLVTASHDTAYALQIIRGEINDLISKTADLEKVDPNFKQLSRDLYGVNTVIIDCCITSGLMYHQGLDALKGDEA